MSEQKYLVGLSDGTFRERDFAIVTAPGPDEAIGQFGKLVATKGKLFLAFVYGRVSNADLPQHFLFVTDEEHEAFIQQGTVLASPELFEFRVREFFGPHRDYANLYLEHYWGDQDQAFPPEMLLHVWLKCFGQDYEAVALTDIELGGTNA